jgi:hypothetical protein
MVKADVSKEGHRVNMFFPGQLYAQMKEWVQEHNTNITELCREAIHCYLRNEQLELKHKQLVETCRMLSESHIQNLEQWTPTIKAEREKGESLGL